MVVRRLVGGDADLAADIAQEVWIQIFRALPSYRGDSQFSTWAHRIAVNRTLNALTEDQASGESRDRGDRGLGVGGLPRDHRRCPPRAGAADCRRGPAGQPHFGALTFHPTEEGLLEVPVGTDELVLLVPPSHRLAGRRQVSMSDIAEEPVVAHNDPSPARERVLRLFEEHHVPLHMVIALPSLDGIKRAVELKLGVALLPRRCAITELASGQLVAIPVKDLSRKREVTLVCRKAHRSHAADAFLAAAQQKKEIG